MSFGVFDSQSVILCDFKENIPGFYYVKNKGITYDYYSLFVLIYSYCCFEELIVLIIADFLLFCNVFCSENGQKNTLSI